MPYNYSLPQKIKRLFKHGLFLEAIFTRIAKIGINIRPFYIFQEYYIESFENKFNNCLKAYESLELTHEDMESISQDRGWNTIDSYKKLLDQGKKCFGVKFNGQLAAFTWVNIEKCNFIGDPFPLKKNEAYLFDAYTFPAFRGKGLAPAVRFQCYKSLHAIGITKFYSYSIAYNTPAIIFKQKLGAKILKFGIWLEFFSKYNWARILRYY